MMVLGAEPIQTVPRQVLDADLDFNINTNITVKPQHDNAWRPCGLHCPGHNAACTGRCWTIPPTAWTCHHVMCVWPDQESGKGQEIQVRQIFHGRGGGLVQAAAQGVL